MPNTQKQQSRLLSESHGYSLEVKVCNKTRLSQSTCTKSPDSKHNLRRSDRGSSELVAVECFGEGGRTTKVVLLEEEEDGSGLSGFNPGGGGGGTSSTTW